MYSILFHFKHCKSFLPCIVSAPDKLLFELNKKMLSKNKDIVIDFILIES